MTRIRQVVETVRATDGWYLTRTGMLRRNPAPGWQCPITAMEGLPAGKFRGLASHIGLGTARMDVILAAADNEGFITRTPLRRSSRIVRRYLLKAANLTEES